ncbi:hypothetical protein DSCW_14840 [Desulfosarcina widdelii]|uniref:Uncharacterized protein n=1 Tax=Desulfosarcina widdelii TaxID=947919 RepID=A0A5K7ZCU2_9BACT|nr:hypothetical protein [Desulfosarcina widdelii]BBO74067.1 hypothetical protein DSCW_14840 [Desulfosarcina widdelii]
MTRTKPTIENLTKVSLNITAEGKTTPNDQAAVFEFIYGVGADGITPFEKVLFGKSVGDHVRMDIGPAGYRETVGHLELPLFEQIGIATATCLMATVTGITKPEDREVVKAMASGGSCSDCGCGCGGH